MESVEFDVTPVPGIDDEVDVDFTVKEQSAGSFTAGLAYGFITVCNLTLVSVSQTSQAQVTRCRLISTPRAALKV